MHLCLIKNDIWTIYASCAKDGSCQVLSFLNNLNPKYHGSRTRLFAILARATSEHTGPSQFPVEISHLASSNAKIYEFIAGDIRLLWFYSQYKKRVIVCSAAYLKKTKKVDKRLIASAIKIQKQYVNDCQTGDMHISGAEEKS